MNPLYIANEGRRVATQESMDLKDRRSSLLEALIHVRSALVILRVIKTRWTLYALHNQHWHQIFNWVFRNTGKSVLQDENGKETNI